MNSQFGVIVFALLITQTLGSAEESSKMDNQIDQRSYQLGGVGSFAEMVRVGVKTLALSAAMLPEEMDAIEEDIKRIANNEGIRIYRETDLIVTDLFPADVAEGKHVILLYKGTTLDEYLALKQKKNELVKSGNYSGKARKDIARQFGKLLSYPDVIIEEKIK